MMRRTAVLALVAGSLVGLAPAASAQLSQETMPPEQRGLPELDVRWDADGGIMPFVTDAIARARAGVKADQAGVARAALAGELPGVMIDEDPYFGTPRAVYRFNAFLTGPITRPARDIAAQYVRDHAALFEIDAAELASARMEREFRTDHNGVTHLTFQQQIRGVDLQWCEVRANVMPTGELINISSTMLPRPVGDFAVSPVRISDADALRVAAADAGVTIGQLPLAPAAVGADAKRVWPAIPGLRADEPAVTKLVYFPRTRDDIRSAWGVVVAVPGLGHTYDYVIDATTGDVLRRQDRLLFATTQPITMRVYTSDSPTPMSPGTPTPSGFQPPEIPRQLITIQPADMAPYSPNGWIDDGNMETLGNNCDAHTDLDASPNIPDLPRPNGGAARVFDFALDLTLAPSTYRNATVTQLFYLTNKYHDSLFAMGFNEGAKNFQTINFSGVGAGNDAIQADAQDSSGTNNANFSTTGTDGSTGRCQMYIFTGPTPDRDGSLDADVVYHELTHGTSIRIHNGLSGSQPPGMGEGWGDFFGLCLNTQAGDDPNGVYATGGYVTRDISAGFVNNYYFGIRRFPYSTDMRKNPETYRDIDGTKSSFPASIPRGPIGSATANEVHNQGEVWCQMLWDMHSNLIASRGSSGNDLALQLVLDGMKLSVANPTFLQARIAILAADTAAGGTNQADIWDAFAKRGAGQNATSPASTLTTGINEDFTSPYRVDFSYPSGTPRMVGPAGVSFPVTLTPQLLTITPGTARVEYSVNGGAIQSSPLALVSGNNYTATIPGSSCFSLVSYTVKVGTNRGTKVDPTLPGMLPAPAFHAITASSESDVFVDDFEIDRGWVATSTATAGAWVRADPIASPIQPENDHTPGAGVNCFITGQGTVNSTSASAADIDGGTVTLTSPTFSLAGSAEAVISYWRFFFNGNDAGDTFTTQLSSDNGASWTTVQTISSGPNADGEDWLYSEIRLSDFPAVARTATMKLRFNATDQGTATNVEAGVDDVAIRTYTCAASTCHGACVADYDDGSGTGTPDGGVTIDDLLYYLRIFDLGQTCADVDDGSATGTPDGGVTIDDLLYYLFRFDSGC